jgi:predicted transcriptional regulator
MKSVLISIQPKWCELIALGKKTVEVRKTKPKLETPFKVYIYCTNKFGEAFFTDQSFGRYAVSHLGNSKVIGEFVCDSIHHYRYTKPFFYYGKKMCHTNEGCAKACLSWEELENYLGDKDGYGWHISDLVIYDKPRKLSEFKKINRDCWYADLGLAKRDCPECKNAGCMVQRPPQSWCYVESEVQG